MVLRKAWEKSGSRNLEFLSPFFDLEISKGFLISLVFCMVCFYPF